MEGATLTINFRDDSSNIPQSPAATPQQGTAPSSSLVQDQQRAITEAGGAGNLASRNQVTTQSASSAPPPAATVTTVPVAPSVPVPTVTTASGMPTGEAALALSVQKIVAADPTATAEEIARLLGGGVTANQVRGMMAGTGPAAPPAAIPPAPASPAANPPPVRSTVDDLVAQTRELWDRDLVASTRQMWDNDSREQEVRARTAASANQRPEAPYVPTPPPLSPQQQIEEAERRAPPRQAPDLGGQVQSTVNSIAHLMHMGGPLGSAAAGAITAGASVPGVASAIGAAAPALATAAPFVAAAAAGVGISVGLATAAFRAVEGTAERAIGNTLGLSPDVSSAAAQAEVRQLMANQRTARILGNEAADFLSARSVIRTEAQTARDLLMEGPLQQLNNILNLQAEATSGFRQLLESIPAPIRNAGTRTAFSSFLNFITPGRLPGMPGLGTVFDTLSFLGSFAPKPAKPDVGLSGIVPERPRLPAPFNTENWVERDRQRLNGRPTPAF